MTHRADICAKINNPLNQIFGVGANAAFQYVGFVLTPLYSNVADIDGNCRVDIDDLVRVIVDWGQSDSPADLNGDGSVGIDDVVTVIVNWSN